MKIKLCIIICCFVNLNLLAQQNNTLRGKMLFLSSSKTPAMGVEVSGSIEKIEKANVVYTANDGAYNLVFPNAKVGHRVKLDIGKTDKNGQLIELVNDKELGICQIPAKVTDEFEIIVCPKGARDLAAQKYYNIIKTSSDIALAQKKKEFEALLAQQQKDYRKITEMGERITQLEKQNDSLTIYKEALNIASINKDNATQRVLRYIQLLDEGKSIQEAREALSIQEATNELEKNIIQFNAAIKELETRADASKAIFDYKDAINCYENIISYSEKLDINPLKIAEYYIAISINFTFDAQPQKSLEYSQKAITIYEKTVEPPIEDMARAYLSIATGYIFLMRIEKAMEYSQRAITIYEKILEPPISELASAYLIAAMTYNLTSQPEKAMEYNQKAIVIYEKISESASINLLEAYTSTAYTLREMKEYERALEYNQKVIRIIEKNHKKNDFIKASSYGDIALTYKRLKQYENALEFEKKAIEIYEKILDRNHPIIAIAFNKIALTYLLLKQFGIALEFEKKAVDILKNLPNKHPQEKDILEDLKLFYAAKAWDAFNKKDYKTAKDDFLAIHNDFQTESEELWNYIGLCNYYLKDYSKAIEAYQKALSISPEYKTKNYYNNIGTAYVKNKQFKESFDAFMEYEKLFPKDGRPYRNWAMYYALQNDKEKALSYLQKAVELGYDDIEWLKTDDSMDSIRKEKAFIEIVEKLEKEKKK